MLGLTHVSVWSLSPRRKTTLTPTFLTVSKRLTYVSTAYIGNVSQTSLQTITKQIDNMITFSIHCTLPLAAPAFVQGPNIRPRWVSCGSLFRHHLPVHLVHPPPQRPATGPRTAGRAGSTVQAPARRTAVPVRLPEKGQVDDRHHAGAREVAWFQALRNANPASRDESEHEVSWTVTHSMYADMGGFAVRFPRQPPGPTAGSTLPSEKRDEWLDYNHGGHPYLGLYDWRSTRRTTCWRSSSLTPTCSLGQQLQGPARPRRRRLGPLGELAARSPQGGHPRPAAARQRDRHP